MITSGILKPIWFSPSSNRRNHQQASKPLPSVHFASLTQFYEQDSFRNPATIIEDETTRRKVIAFLKELQINTFQDFKQRLETISPENVRTWSALAGHLRHDRPLSKDVIELSRTIYEAIVVTPNISNFEKSTACLNLAKLDRRDGNTASFHQRIEQALTFYPKNPYVLLHYAEFFSGQANTQQVFKYYRLAETATLNLNLPASELPNWDTEKKECNYSPPP